VHYESKAIFNRVLGVGAREGGSGDLRDQAGHQAFDSGFVRWST